MVWGEWLGEFLVNDTNLTYSFHTSLKDHLYVCLFVYNCLCTFLIYKWQIHHIIRRLMWQGIPKKRNFSEELSKVQLIDQVNWDCSIQFWPSLFCLLQVISPCPRYEPMTSSFRLWTYFFLLRLKPLKKAAMLYVYLLFKYKCRKSFYKPCTCTFGCIWKWIWSRAQNSVPESGHARLFSVKVIKMSRLAIDC